jgi:uncharacterized protein YjgD (DUF1641 family)
MATPIPFVPPPRDPREALYHQLEKAPTEHVEALLATYEVLQGLHDRGLLEIVRGALGSSDKVLQILVEAASSPEAIRGTRNLIILAKIAGSLEPELLESLAQAVPEGVTQAKIQKPPGLWRLLKMASGVEARRALGMLTSILQSVGKSLGEEKHP